MDRNDMLKRYLDAGIAFTKMTQERAEAIVKDLVSAGEVASDQAAGAVADIVERSRENTERLFEGVRAEIATQIGNLGLATRDDVESLRREVAALKGGGTPAPASPAAAPTAAKRAPAAKKASAAKKAPVAPVTLPGTAAPAAKAPAAKATAAKGAPARKKAPASKAAPKTSAG